LPPVPLSAVLVLTELHCHQFTVFRTCILHVWNVPPRAVLPYFTGWSTGTMQLHLDSDTVGRDSRLLLWLCTL